MTRGRRLVDRVETLTPARPSTGAPGGPENTGGADGIYVGDGEFSVPGGQPPIAHGGTWGIPPTGSWRSPSP